MCLLLGLLRQPGEKKRASSSKGSSSLLADLAPTLPTLGSVNSAAQCKQQDNWHRKQDQQFAVLYS